jgi:hypothetical protein
MPAVAMRAKAPETTVVREMRVSSSSRRRGVQGSFMVVSDSVGGGSSYRGTVVRHE